MYSPPRIILALGLATASFLGLSRNGARADGGAVRSKELRRGLVTTYRDPGRPASTTVVRLEPTVALALNAGEAPHPRLRGDGGMVVWQGRLNVVQAGAYRFAVRLSGRIRIRVGGKEVLTAESIGGKVGLKEGKTVSLELGPQPLIVEFTQPRGVARVELLWEGPEFRREPLLPDSLGHLPADEGNALAKDAQLERGRYLAEEANCIRCHRAEDDDRMARDLVSHQGPDLSRGGARLHPGWMFRWLESPRALRPGAVMPELFTPDEAGRVERYAVVRYLVSLGGPIRPAGRLDRKEQMASRIRGRALFQSAGCVACHGGGPEEAKAVATPPRPTAVLYPRPGVYPLRAMGSRTTPEELAAYLLDPLAVDPSGRMPRVPLSPREAQDVAHYLCHTGEDGVGPDLPKAPSAALRKAAFVRVDDRKEELADFEKHSEENQWLDLGKRLVIDRGCNNCHVIAPGGKSFASMLASSTLDDLKKPARHREGCLADAPGKRGKAPWFAFTAEDRTALRASLTTGLTGAGSPAPAYAARRNLERFNCLACHGRDGEGGLAPALIEALRRSEKADHAEAVVPPPLTGVGHKLRTPWLRQVLLGGARARPWMGLRMPQFGTANLGKLAEGLALLEGTEPEEKVHKVVRSADRIAAGRRLVGKSAFGCISCHDFAGIPNTGTRGPDLAGMTQRVRYAWYRRWLEEPQRLQPGTRMPSVFSDGKSLVTGVLGGSADAQAEAMWAYLSLGPGLPLPEGVRPRKNPR